MTNHLDLVIQVRRELVAAGVVPPGIASPNECARFTIVNEVAKRLKAAGEAAGLLSKSLAGSGCRRGDTNYTSDVVAYRTGEIVDILGGGEVDGISTDSKPSWNVTEPASEAVAADIRTRWRPPFDSLDVVPEPPERQPGPAQPTIPPYPGDEFGTRIGQVLFADFAAAGRTPSAGMGVWFLRTTYDFLAGLSLDESIAKHRKEWRQLLGLP